VNAFATAVMPWLHPATGLVTVLLLARAAAFGLAARRGGTGAPEQRASHVVLARRVWWLVLANWMLGLATVWAFRPELEVADSTHFSAGTGVLVLLTVARVLSRWVPTDARARAIHPMVGAAALLLASVQVFLGLQLTRW
jgi:hypothetical protein